CFGLVIYVQYTNSVQQVTIESSNGWSATQPGSQGTTTFYNVPTSVQGTYITATQGTLSGGAMFPYLTYEITITLDDGSEPEPDPEPNND
ncbi:MAG: hypothetical protein K9N07_11840, partial [Candidatus Cloacimonetes bacterium]|nr:hypothetical protein [Candidatus Cloacimonadota bacterium]